EVVRHLGGRPDAKLLTSETRFNQNASCFHGVAAAAMLPNVIGKHMRSLRESCLNIPIAYIELIEDIRLKLSPHGDGTCVSGAACIGYGRKRLVIDLNHVSGVLSFSP